jgi:hypothetical protein
LVVILLLGSLLDLAVPSWGGLLWRTAVLAGVTLLGLFIPIPFAGSILAAIVLIVLFEMDLATEWMSIVAFVVAYGIAMWAVSFFLFAALIGSGA